MTRTRDVAALWHRQVCRTRQAKGECARSEATARARFTVYILIY